MRASSQAALQLAQERWEPVLRESGERALALGEQLFAVVDTLDSSAALRRALTEPSRDGGDKARLAATVLQGKVDAEVVDLVSGLVRERWSHDGDLADAVESLAVTSVLASAQQAGRLADVEDESFRLVRMFADERELRGAVEDRNLSPARRSGLMESVLSGRVAPEMLVLAMQAARTLRHRSVTSALRVVTELAAERRAHLVASVSSATPLTREQIERLAGILRRSYGRDVQVHVGVDPELVGGIRVQVGDDVIDGTLATRLADARRRLAG
ncbi:F0F1 ATP synthase subunit delta [Georgenia yuyongxinii]|uniref:ATP synthase subunit delta n=1 Tax=Georgenia yuyongxinii TaxID=2589797 RepID=A0A552WKV2_9MICO|nr:F0F1 ATP synthase subunit delta [Georgenia yuyongxinii]TRW43411.1 F0F1 ATP synthase subunit delta [Georgenia yuyongxinii]